MRLAQIMTQDVLGTTPQHPVGDAIEEMRRRNVHHLVVIEDGKVVGILSMRDCQNAAQGQRVGDVMRTEIVTASTETTVREAANLLRGNMIGCLPVFEADQLVGIVTITDLLELLGRGAERPVAESTRWTLGSRPSRAAKRP
jgi:acetoin utilization protein AcuB